MIISPRGVGAWVVILVTAYLLSTHDRSNLRFLPKSGPVPRFSADTDQAFEIWRRSSAASSSLPLESQWREADVAGQPTSDPLVPRIVLDGSAYDAGSNDVRFEPHGHELCASGCAVSHHPTRSLTQAKFEELIANYAAGEVASKSLAQTVRDSSSPKAAPLDSLLFYGPQTSRWLRHTACEIPSQRRQFLERQLELNHAVISIRLKDEFGRLWAYLEDAVVPLDRRHVFQLQASTLPSQTVSGTVKRVGLDYVWTRF